MPDFIPRSDADFVAWLSNFVTYANANLAALGLVAADLTPLTADLAAITASMAANIAAQAAAQSAVQQKDMDRAKGEADARDLVRRLQANGQVDNAEAAALGLNIRDSVRTAVGAPASTPIAQVDTSQRLRHTVSFADAATPTSRAKPDGVRGCEIWVKIGGTPPADPSELSYLATDTATPYLAVFNGEDGGKTAHYMLRWVSTRGEPGPWSETVSATITA